jgi:hypothetical protein
MNRSEKLRWAEMLIENPLALISQLSGELEAKGLRIATSHERAVLEAAAQMKLIREKSSRPPFVEGVVCRSGGKLLVDAEWARREAER